MRILDYLRALGVRPKPYQLLSSWEVKTVRRTMEEATDGLVDPRLRRMAERTLTELGKEES